MSSMCSISFVTCLTVKKGQYVIIKQRPCKVVDVTHAKTGKHGHMKVSIVGIDVLTGNKHPWGGPGHQTITEFKLIKHEYQLVMIDGDTLTCLNSDNKETLVVLKEDTTMYKNIKKDFDAGKTLSVSVIIAPVEISEGKYVDETAVDSFKEDKTAN